MKALLFLLFSTLLLNVDGQILCINCYDQNARVLTDTNNLIINGGFENNNCTGGQSFCPSASFYRCDIAHWKCTGGGINTYARLYGSTLTTIVEGTKAVYFGNRSAYICSATRDTTCLSNLGCEVTGIPFGYPTSMSMGYGGDTGISLAQVVNGLRIGGIYSLEFWAGGESNNNGFIHDGLFAIDIGFGNVFLRDPATEPISGIGRRFVIVFIATSSSQTIKFTNWGHIPQSYYTELVLDDVRLFAVERIGNLCTTSINGIPEPSRLSVFPNPFVNNLNISNENVISEFTLYDLEGRALFHQIFSSSLTLFTGQLISGLYIYEVKSDSVAIERGKIIKE